MQKGFFTVAFLVLAMTGATSAAAIAQLPLLATEPSIKKHAKHAPAEKRSATPSFAMPVTPLGFAAPASFYLGQHVSHLSLDFLDEEHILFTFRVPGLIARQRPAPGESPETVRQIRAVVLALPSGEVTAEALWTLHDPRPYLWMLKGQRFLLRDQNTIQIGDASLHLKPFLRFPGNITNLEIDPSQQFLIANTEEPPAPGSGAESAAMPSTATASIVPDAPRQDAPKPGPANQALLRILSMDTLKVMLFSRTDGVVHLPVDGDGYYEALRGKGTSWVIHRQGFRGATNQLWQVESTCSPPVDVLAPGVVLVSACVQGGGRKLSALTNEKRRLWETTLPATSVWPILAKTPVAGRFARETFEVVRPIGPNNPLDIDDLRGQTVQVYDLATGKVQLEAPASPFLDAGGNFALSPSGRRFAVLNAGAIQVFDLPDAPALPVSAQSQNR